MTSTLNSISNWWRERKIEIDWSALGFIIGALAFLLILLVPAGYLIKTEREEIIRENCEYENLASGDDIRIILNGDTVIKTCP